jgi:hypothetical protein
MPNTSDRARLDREWQEWDRWRKQVQARLARKARSPADALALAERAWAAGFFDGEGTAVSNAVSGKSDDPAREIQAKLDIAQAYGKHGRANLERFQAAVGGVGSITGPYTTRSPKTGLQVQAQHRWRVNSEAGIAQVWAAIGPFLGFLKFRQFLSKALIVPAIRELRSEMLGTQKRVARPNISTVTVHNKRGG